MIHVFGPVFVDVVACANRFTPSSSAIARIDTRVGGVGYNLFRALGDTPRRFVSVIGDGPLSRQVLEALEPEAPRCLLQHMPGRDVGMYVALMQQGALLYGATDASAFEAGMNQTLIDKALTSVTPADLVVADANMHSRALGYLIDQLARRHVPLVFETVSFDKAARAADLVRDVFLTTPTQQELAALLGIDDARDVDNHLVLQWMVERRVEHVIVTMGSRGLRWLHQGTALDLEPTRNVPTSDTTGAGDTFLGHLLQLLRRIMTADRAQPIAALMPGLLRQAMDAVETYLSERPAAAP